MASSIRVRRLVLAEVAQHHHRAEDQRRRVDDVPAGVLRRRAVDRLEDGDLVAVVARRREAEAAHQARREVADDVAVEVRRDHDVELRRRLGELVGDVVDDEMLGRDLRVLRRHLLEDPFEEALGQLHDVGLRGAGDLRAPLAPGQLEGVADDLLRSPCG